MKWSKKPIFWETEDCIKGSFVFSWDLWKWLQEVKQDLFQKPYMIGGTAVRINLNWIPGWIKVGDRECVLNKHNGLATRTSRGCIRKCGFCAVPIIEGNLVELEEWETKPILIDNNLLACSKKHFDNVVDRLKKLDWCDFNQGLDVRLLNRHHAYMFSTLKNPKIRLAFDSIKVEKDFMRSYELLRYMGIPKRNISAYALFGYNDTPEDAFYRLDLMRKIGITPNPARYQPITAKYKNSYVHKNWTDDKLKDMVKYWFNLRHYGSIPFNEFNRDYNKTLKENSYVN